MEKIFKKICRMSQKELKNYVAQRLTATHEKVITRDGFVYAPGKFPVLLVAHMDTVHKKLPTVIKYDQKTKSLSSPEGIGGDDRCGVAMVLEVVKKYNCSVLFCEDEEIGGVGAEKFTKSKIAEGLEFNYIIEFDRKGSNDAVFYDCDNEDFEKFITKEFYKTAWGSFSDISTLAPFLKCAAVNLSCGYYNAHTTREYVVLHEMERSVEEACKILERTTEADKFEYIEAQYYYPSRIGGSSYGYWGGEYDDRYFAGEYDAENYYMIEYVDYDGEQDWADLWAVSEAEAVGKFLMANPRLSYVDIIDVLEERTSVYR